MDKKTFLSDLEKQLSERGVLDIESIIEEYADHFIFKLADGYSEEEIAARLGRPGDIALQYSPPGDIRHSTRGGRKTIAAAGLVLLSILLLCIFILFFSWVIALGALSIACAALGVALLFGFDLTPVVLQIPLPGAVIMGITSIALAVFAGTGTIYSLRYVLQLIKAYVHWNKRCLAMASGRPVSPPIALSPQFKSRTRRLMRTLFVSSMTLFGIGIILGYIVMAVLAGSLEFWHVWGWFVR